MTTIKREIRRYHEDDVDTLNGDVIDEEDDNDCNTNSRTFVEVTATPTASIEPKSTCDVSPYYWYIPLMFIHIHVLVLLQILSLQIVAAMGLPVDVFSLVTRAVLLMCENTMAAQR